MSLSVLRHVDASVAERLAYLKLAAARRRSTNGAAEDETEPPPEANGTEAEDEAVPDLALSETRFGELEAAEELLLTVTDSGFGKRSSAYEYRVTGRGGSGIVNITLSARTGTAVAATFPVRPGDDVMLVTDAGRLIRVPGDQVRITGRQVMGVMLFRLAAGEHVTAVFPVLEDVADPPPGEGAPDPIAEIAAEHVPQSDADELGPDPNPPDSPPDDDMP